MPTLTAIQSYLGWHIGIMILIWGVFLIRFDRIAKEFFQLHHDDSWEAQVLRWGIIIGIDLMIPAVFALPAYYYTGLVHPIAWLIRGPIWLGYWGSCLVLTFMIMLRLGSKSCCCGGGHRPSIDYIGGPPRRLHGHRSNPNRRRQRNAEDNACREVI